MQEGEKTDQGRVKRDDADTSSSYLLFKRWTCFEQKTQKLSLVDEIN